MENHPISKREFIRIMASGSPFGLVNEHEDPIDLSIHPLLYSPDFVHYPDFRCVPLLYKVERGFYNAYKEVRK